VYLFEVILKVQEGVYTLWCTKNVVTLCSFQSRATLVVHYMNMRFPIIN
jgi:hypothetical protein